MSNNTTNHTPINKDARDKGFTWEKVAPGELSLTNICFPRYARVNQTARGPVVTKGHFRENGRRSEVVIDRVYAAGSEAHTRFARILEVPGVGHAIEEAERWVSGS